MSDTLNLDTVRRFVRVKNKIAEVEEQLEHLKAEREKLAEIVAADMAVAGVDAVPLSVDGESFNVYTQQPLIVWRKEGVSAEQLVEACRDAGLEWIVKENVNANTLQAEVREMLANGDKLDPKLANALTIFQKTELRVRSSNKAESASSRAARNLKG
jgi:hypothetical protein